MLLLNILKYYGFSINLTHATLIKSIKDLNNNREVNPSPDTWKLSFAGTNTELFLLIIKSRF
jgi:hypothetical protein